MRAASALVLVLVSGCAAAPCEPASDAGLADAGLDAPDDATTDAPQATAAITITPSTLGLDSPCRPVRTDFVVHNVGTAPSGPVAVALGGASRGVVMVDTTCAGSLEPDETCVVTIEVRPTSSTGPIEMPELRATLLATGATASALMSVQPVADACGFDWVTPSPHVFGDVPVGSTATQTFTFHDGGDRPERVEAWIDGPDWARFWITPGSDHCNGAMVPSGGSCTVEVTFAPSAMALHRATLSIGTARAALSGNGA